MTPLASVLLARPTPTAPATETPEVRAGERDRSADAVAVSVERSSARTNTPPVTAVTLVPAPAMEALTDERTSFVALAPVPASATATPDAPWMLTAMERLNAVTEAMTWALTETVDAPTVEPPLMAARAARWRRSTPGPRRWRVLPPLPTPTASDPAPTLASIAACVVASTNTDR